MNIQIEKEDVERKISALSTILNTMNVPDLRKDVTRMSNIRWLSRNLRVQNSDHPMFDTANEMVNFIFRKSFLLKKEK
tara:strand:+ start:121 stop:354 length:234 start_codon:yes stop_codon:yes gene_type:complete